MIASVPDGENSVVYISLHACYPQLAVRIQGKTTYIGYFAYLVKNKVVSGKSGVNKCVGTPLGWCNAEVS